MRVRNSLLDALVLTIGIGATDLIYQLETRNKPREVDVPPRVMDSCETKLRSFRGFLSPNSDYEHLPFIQYINQFPDDFSRDSAIANARNFYCPELGVERPGPRILLTE